MFWAAIVMFDVSLHLVVLPTAWILRDFVTQLFK